MMEKIASMGNKKLKDGKNNRNENKKLKDGINNSIGK